MYCRVTYANLLLMHCLCLMLFWSESMYVCMYVQVVCTSITIYSPSVDATPSFLSDLHIRLLTMSINKPDENGIRAGFCRRVYIAAVVPALVPVPVPIPSPVHAPCALAPRSLASRRDWCWWPCGPLGIYSFIIRHYRHTYSYRIQVHMYFLSSLELATHQPARFP